MSATLTTDILPSSVPKLMPMGMNWTAFSIRFEEAIDAKGLWGHFDGTTPRPVLAVSPPTQTESDEMAKWDRDEKTVKALLTHQIPDSTLIHIHAKFLLKDRWDLITVEYTQKGAFVQADLRTRFMKSQCPEKGSIQELLDSLQVKWEELATYGVTIEEKDYHSTIISSLPVHLSNFASTLLANAQLYATTKTVDPDELIALISEESERNVAHCSHRGGRSSKDDKDEAMTVSSVRWDKKDLRV